MKKQDENVTPSYCENERQFLVKKDCVISTILDAAYYLDTQQVLSPYALNKT